MHMHPSAKCASCRSVFVASYSYDSVIARLETGATFCDASYCFAQEIRHLVYQHQLDSSKFFGFDLDDAFIKFGYELSRDRETLKGTFRAGDVLGQSRIISGTEEQEMKARSYTGSLTLRVRWALYSVRRSSMCLTGMTWSALRCAWSRFPDLALSSVGNNQGTLQRGAQKCRLRVAGIFAITRRAGSGFGRTLAE